MYTVEFRALGWSLTTDSNKASPEEAIALTDDVGYSKVLKFI